MKHTSSNNDKAFLVEWIREKNARQLKQRIIRERIKNQQQQLKEKNNDKNK